MGKYLIYVFACLYAIFGWTLNFQLGFLSEQNIASDMDARDAGAALVLPALTAFLIMGNLAINKVGANALAQLSSVNKTWDTKRLKSHFTHFLNLNTIRCLKFVIVLAVVAASTYLIASGVLFYESTNDMRVVLLLQAVPLWTSILLILNSIYNVYRVLRKILRYRLRLSLFEVEKLSPIGHFLITVFFIFCGALAIYALNILFIPLSTIDIALITVFSLIMLAALILPLNTLQTTLTQQKQEALQNLNLQLLEHIGQSNKAKTNRRLVDDHKRLQYVSDLLLVRKELSSQSSMPVSQSTVIKLMVLFFLPLLSWVGAGVVSQMLKIIE